MFQRKTLFVYKETKVVAETNEDSSVTLSINMRGIEQIIASHEREISLFDYSSKDAEKIKKSVPFYIEVAQAFGDIKAEGWEVYTTFEGEVKLCKNGVEKMIWWGLSPSKRLSKRRTKTVLRRFPNQKTLQKASDESSSCISLDELAEIGKESRKEVVIAQAVKNLSSLNTDEVLQVMDRINLTPTDADIAKLLNT